jgi:hypothetical protein
MRCARGFKPLDSAMRARLTATLSIVRPVAWSLIVVSLLPVGSATGGGKEAQFWRWFEANEARLFHFQDDMQQVFAELGDQLEKVHPDLAFEIGAAELGKREFVISAQGLKAAFPAVRALHAAAPDLPRWTWTKFRPRRRELSDVDFGGRTLRVDAVTYKMFRDGEKVGLVLYVDGYIDREHEFFGEATYLMLDQALGEETVETDVGFIELRATDHEKAAGAHPLSRLAAHFDRHQRAKEQRRPTERRSGWERK